MTLTRREYHALTRGFIIQELFRRVEPHHRTIGTFLKAEVFDPLCLNISIGLSEEEQKKTKIAANVSLTDQEVRNKYHTLAAWPGLAWPGLVVTGF